MGIRIGFIGAGKMATAMIEGLLSKGLYRKDEIIASCRSAELPQVFFGSGSL